MVMDEPSPLSVGREFVRQYYTLLNEAPLHLHRFYSQESSFVHGGLDNDKDCQPVYGQQDIHARIKQLNFRECKAKIRHLDAHATLANGVVVQVSGELSNNVQPMRRFMQTFVLARNDTPKKYYVHNDIFRYQDEVFSDDEVEEDNEDATESEQTTLSSMSPNVARQPVIYQTSTPAQVIKPLLTPGTSVGIDGITTVSINAVIPGQHVEVKKDGPHLNGGHGPSLPVMEVRQHSVQQPGQAEVAPTSVAPLTTPGVTTTMRPVADVTSVVNQPPATVVQPQPPRGPVQQQPLAPQPLATQPVVPQPVRAMNHVPEPEPESSDEPAASPTIEKEESQPIEVVAELQPQEKPAQQNQPAEQPPAEPRNQGPPTYANLVKSGPTLIPNRGSLPSAGFGKPSAVSPAPPPSGNSSGPAGPVAQPGGNPAAGAASNTSAKDLKDSTTFGGQNQHQNSAKFRGHRQSLGGNSRGGGSGGSGRERYGFSKDSGEGPNQDGQERRRTIGGGGGSGGGQYPDTQQLFVGNLPHNCTEDDLEQLFGKFGKVAEVRISSKGVAQSKTTASGQRVPSFGFVVFEEERAVQDCLKHKPIHLSDGHRLNVETKKNKPMMRAEGQQQMDNMSATVGSTQNRGSQEHLGNIGRGSDRPRGGSRGGQRGGGGRGGGTGSSGRPYSESGGRGGMQGSGGGGGEARGGPPLGSNRGGSYSRRS